MNEMRLIDFCTILLLSTLCWSVSCSNAETTTTLEEEYRVIYPNHLIASPEEGNDARRRLQSVNEEAFETVSVDAPIDPSTGPWPECLGMCSDDCIQLIESKAEDVYTVVVLPIETEQTRVWVSVDENGKVNKVPYRG